MKVKVTLRKGYQFKDAWIPKHLAVRGTIYQPKEEKGLAFGWIITKVYVDEYKPFNLGNLDE